VILVCGWCLKVTSPSSRVQHVLGCQDAREDLAIARANASGWRGELRLNGFPGLS
jgi:hypothetical protein